MKLLTHNVLKSNVKQANSGFPLRIEATKVEFQEQEFNPEFIQSMLQRLDYRALLKGYEALKGADDPELPPFAPKEESEVFLKLVHHALLEVVLVEGALVCPDTGRKFKVEFGIPNMLLNEDEL
jgi:multifunctional methyltransferase subunit TRM112